MLEKVSRSDGVISEDEVIPTGCTVQCYEDLLRTVHTVPYISTQ